MLELGWVGETAGVRREDGHHTDEKCGGQRGKRAEDQRREWRNLVTRT
jgi:hypothetical protein